MHLTFRRALLALSFVAAATAEESPAYKAIGGSPNEVLKELAEKGTNPYIFTDDFEFSKAPPDRRVDENGKPVHVFPKRYNPDCWAASLDLTGVAWYSGINGVAITPRHIISAAHWNNLPHVISFVSEKPGKDGETKVGVGFIPVKGKDHPAFKPTLVTIQDRPVCWINLGNDVAIATTTAPLPDSVAIYPLPAPVAAADREGLIGRTLLATTWSDDLHQPDPRGIRLAGLRKVYKFSQETMWYAQDDRLPADLYFPAVIGDSANPLFFVGTRDKQLVLASQFSGGGPGTGSYLGSAEIQDNIRRYIAASPAPNEKLKLYNLETGEIK